MLVLIVVIIDLCNQEVYEVNSLEREEVVLVCEKDL